MLNLEKIHTKCTKEQNEIFKEYCNNAIIDKNENHFRGKCAEVYLENGKYFINCYFCGKTIQNIEYLINHIYQEHFKLNVPDNLKQDQQQLDEQDKHHNIGDDSDKIVWKTELHLDNVDSNSVTDTITLDLDKNDTNEVFTDEFNNCINEATNEIEIFDIPNTPIQYRDINGLYPCSFCTLTFKKCIELEKHFIKHTNSDENQLKTDDWKSDFYDNNINNFPSEEIKGKRHEDGNYHCELCNRKYIHHYNYRSHFLQAHKPNLNPYKCPDCPSTYTMRHRFEIHRRTHTGEKPYKCPHCPRAFALNTNLTRHIYIHLGKKPYKCRFCGRGFTQQNSQKAHERNIHTKERPHQCELCGKAFPRSTLLKEHWKRHTNTRPFQCTICFKNFFNNSSLKLHLNTHTGEKSYDCNLCSKKFTNANSLRTHKKLHLDTKQYQCKLCDKAFAQNAGLYGHMKMYHESVTKMDN